MIKTDVIEALASLPDTWGIRARGDESSLAVVSGTGAIAIAIIEVPPSASQLNAILADTATAHGAGLGTIAVLACLSRQAGSEVLEHIVFADELSRLPGLIVGRAAAFKARGISAARPAAPPLLGVALLGPAKSHVQDTPPSPTQPDSELIKSLQMPVGTRSLRSRRTKAINDDPSVRKARAEVELRLGSWFIDPAKARTRMEKARIDPDHAATIIAMGDKRFGERSPVARLPNGPLLAVALTNLFDALDSAEYEAKLSISE
jgi:hypothetical protein